MRLISRATQPSPRDPAFVRVSAKVEVESRGAILDYWLDLPGDLTDDLSDEDNGWAILLLPLACYYNEPLVLSGPVDRFLLDNLKGVQQVWSAWYPELTEIPIKASDIRDVDRAAIPATTGKRTISCFSGGIDSFFTLLRHDKAVLGDGTTTVDDLLSVAGFNSAMDDFDQMRADLEPAATSFGRRLIPVMTNLRYGEQPIETPYSVERLMVGFAHMALLAGIVHLLGKRYREFLIPASHHYANLMPYGSHPLTDRLFSSSRISIVHDGASFTRIERTEVIAKSDEALRSLHVCWLDFRDGNCSKCQKCVRTMAALDILGARSRALSFDWSNYSPETVSKIWLSNPSDRIHYVDIALAAERLSRPDIVAAAYAAVAASKRKYEILQAINSIPVVRPIWNASRGMRNRIRARIDAARTPSSHA